MCVQSHWFTVSDCCNEHLESNHQTNEQTLHHQTINKMVIQSGGKHHRVAAWYIQALRLKICHVISHAKL